MERRTWLETCVDRRCGALQSGLAVEGAHRRGRRRLRRRADWREGPGDDGAVVRSGGESSGGVRRGHPARLLRAGPVRRRRRRGAHQRQRRRRHGRRAAGRRRHAGRRRGDVPDRARGHAPRRRPVRRPGRRRPPHRQPRTATRCRRSRSAGAPAPSLAAASVRPGQRLGLLGCLDGTMRADFPFFPSFDERGDRLAGDVRLLAELADGRVVHGRQGRQHGRPPRLAGHAARADRAAASRSPSTRSPCPPGVDLVVVAGRASRASSFLRLRAAGREQDDGRRGRRPGADATHRSARSTPPACWRLRDGDASATVVDLGSRASPASPRSTRSLGPSRR